MPAFSESLKRQVLERDGWRCQICGRGRHDGTPLEVHHVIARGMGGDPSKNVPENLITLCAECHRKIHPDKGMPWKIVRWDPDDFVNGLEVIDSEGHRVPHHRLWFYRKQVVEEAKEYLNTLEQYSKASRWNAWQAAEAALWLRAQKAYELLDAGSFYELMASYGITSSEAKKLVRVARLARERGVWEKMLGVDINRADRILRKTPDNELDEWISKAKSLGPADFEKEWRERFGQKKMKTYLVLDKADGARLVEAEDEEQVPGEVVVRVGAVVRGREKVEK